MTFKYAMHEPAQEDLLTLAVLTGITVIACVWGVLDKRWKKIKEAQRPIDDRMKDQLAGIPSNVKQRFFDADEADRMDYNLPRAKTWELSDPSKNQATDVIKYVNFYNLLKGLNGIVQHLSSVSSLVGENEKIPTLFKNQLGENIVGYNKDGEVTQVKFEKYVAKFPDDQYYKNFNVLARSLQAMDQSIYSSLTKLCKVARKLVDQYKPTEEKKEELAGCIMYVTACMNACVIYKSLIQAWKKNEQALESVDATYKD